MAARDHTVQLNHRTFEELEIEARKRRVGADELADELVRAGIAETTARSGSPLREALAVLDAVGARMPEIEAGRILPGEQEQLGAHVD